MSLASGVQQDRLARFGRWEVTEAPSDSRSYVRYNATWNPLDADLVALAALTGTNTIYYRSGIDTWSPVSIGSGIGFSGGTISSAAGGGNVSNSGTPVVGQLARWINNQQIEGVNSAAILSPPHDGQFNYWSPTQIRFVPDGGNKIKVAGNLLTIPNTGIAAANTSVYKNGVLGNLDPNTTYLVTVFNNAGTPAIDFVDHTYTSSRYHGGQ